MASDSLEYSAGIAPSKIEVLAWEASSTTSVTVKWELPEFNGGLPLTHFSVYFDIGQTGTFEEYNEYNTFMRTFTLAGQTTGELVDFRLSASNVNLEGELSNVLTVYIATQPDKPAKPVEESILLLDSEKLAVQIGWAEPANGGAPITGYELWVSDEQ